MIDVSLITMDRAAREHAVAFSDPALSSGQPPEHGWGILRDIFTFGLRIALLVGSLTITAPYLAQVVFHKDIQRFSDNEAASALDAARKQITEGFSAQVERKTKALEEKRSLLEQEVAGKGLSGKYGMGPAAQTLAKDVKALEEERDAQLRAKDAAISAYDRLAGDWRINRDTLQAQYNVDLPQTSILQNRKALEELRKRPENRSTELAIRAFLAFIFAGLLLLKLFEPGSVRLYLSDALQQEFNSYVAGTFDPMLPTTEQSTAKNFTMSPQRFFDFLVRTGIRARRLAEENEDAIKRAIASNRTLAELDQVRENMERELQQLRKDHLSARETLDQKTHAAKTWETAMTVVQGDIQYLKDSLDSAQQTMAEPEGRIEDEQSRFEFHRNRIEIQSKLKKDLANAKLALSKLRARDGYQQSARRAEQDYQALDAQVNNSAMELDKITRNIRAVRQRVAEDQARIILGRRA
jgi:hypothetical protein